MVISEQNRGAKLRGIFVNTGKAKCSIHESGIMVYNCLNRSSVFELAYVTLDEIDLAALAGEGVMRFRDAAASGESPEGDVDFWIFNWHHITMAMHVDPQSIAGLRGLKFTIVLELAADNSLVLMPPNVFDGFIALDPTTPSSNGIFPFPRPLQGKPSVREPRLSEVPVIGSFGFGTAGKGFELLVEAVNREFERAVVRINVPRGTFVATDRIHNQDYGSYIASMCRRIAKPGIEVEFTHEFLNADDLTGWCAANDLNCFMYTRSQPGLSATTDQAILSGRPLLTLSNDTFRHIHQYIPPYPYLSLRDAMDTTTAAVHRMRHDWSPEAFQEAFHKMLAAFGLTTQQGRLEPFASEQSKATVLALIAHTSGTIEDDVLDYSTRVANAIGRTGEIRTVRLRCRDVSDLKRYVSTLRPTATLLVDFEEKRFEQAADAVGDLTALVALTKTDGAYNRSYADGALKLIERTAVIPFRTIQSGLAPQPAVWLIGFGHPSSNLEAVLVRIADEQPTASIALEAAPDQLAALQSRLTTVVSAEPSLAGLRVGIWGLPQNSQEIVELLAPHKVLIFYYDVERARELENVSSLMMISERAVTFTRAAPFAAYGNAATFIEDFGIAEIEEMGVKAQIAVVWEFGEWSFYSKIRALLADSILLRQSFADDPEQAVDLEKALENCRAHQIFPRDAADHERLTQQLHLGREPLAEKQPSVPSIDRAVGCPLRRFREAGDRLTGGGLRSLAKRMLAAMLRRTVRKPGLLAFGRVVLKPFPRLATRLYRLAMIANGAAVPSITQQQANTSSIDSQVGSESAGSHVEPFA